MDTLFHAVMVSRWHHHRQLLSWGCCRLRGKHHCLTRHSTLGSRRAMKGGRLAEHHNGMMAAVRGKVGTATLLVAISFFSTAVLSCLERSKQQDTVCSCRPHGATNALIELILLDLTRDRPTLSTAGRRVGRLKSVVSSAGYVGTTPARAQVEWQHSEQCTQQRITQAVARGANPPSVNKHQVEGHLHVPTQVHHAQPRPNTCGSTSCRMAHLHA